MASKHAQEKVASYDVIIIGGGAMGLSSAYWVSKEYGKTCILLEQSGSLFNDQGSSPGKSRMWRVMHSQVKLAKLAKETVPLWHKLQEEARRLNGGEVITPSDMLWVGDKNWNTDGPEGNFNAIPEVSKEAGFPIETISREVLVSKYGFKDIPDSYIGYSGLHNDQLYAGVVNVPILCDVLRQVVQEKKVPIKFNTKVTKIQLTDDDGVEVIATNAKGATVKYKGAKLIMAPGCWANDLLKHFDIKLNLTIWEMSSFYWRKTSEKREFPMWISFAKEPSDHCPNDWGLRYGFPLEQNEAAYVRVCSTSPKITCKDMAEVKHRPDMDECEMLCTWITDHMEGVDPKDVTNISTCLTNYTPDSNYVLDFVPDTQKRVVLFTAGWAMKFVPMFGKLLASLAVDGQAPQELQDLIQDFIIPDNYTDREGLRVEITQEISSDLSYQKTLRSAVKMMMM